MLAANCVRSRNISFSMYSAHLQKHSGHLILMLLITIKYLDLLGDGAWRKSKLIGQ